MEESLLSELQRRVAKTPASPGIYRWLGSKEEVLYIGKAKDLRSRLRSYVQKVPDKTLGPWKLSLLRHIADFDVTVTANELEALVLETNLIKEIRPKYNVMMKDDKNYVYVRITVREKFPEVSVVRRIEEDGAKYFGPYLSSYETKRILDALHSIYHYRACTASIEGMNRGSKNIRPCLEYQIGECNGLCVGEISEERYREAIDHVIRFFRGDRKDASNALQEQMAQAAAAKKFEKAAKLRDILHTLDSLAEKQVVSDTSGANTDAIGVALRGGKVHAVVLRERGGKLIEERSIALTNEGEGMRDILSQFLPQYYGAETDFPDTILIGEDPEDRNVIEAWLTQIRGKRVVIAVPERGKKSRLLTLAEMNADQKIAQQFAKWEAAAQNVASALEELKTLLSLPAAPKRIEGYDISHLGGTETVGSMVVMKNGKPTNAEYRSFTLRTIKEGEIDDYKAIREVLRRRLLHLVQDWKQEEKKWKEKGITIRKAKKADQKEIEKLREERELTTDTESYKETLLALKENRIIAMGRLQKREKLTWEIRAVWVAPDVRGEKIGHFIIRKLLKNLKAGKVFIITKPALEEYYAEVGFRYVIKPPPVMTKVRESYKVSDALFMLYEVSQHKADSSLRSPPDLLVIDGGKGQLNAAMEVLKELDLKIPAIGLAKREEEVFIPDSPVPVLFPNDSQGKFLLMRLRDEAHRFSNAHREKRFAKAVVSSALDTLPGIGPKTKADLLKRFGSIEGIVNAPDEELKKLVNETQWKSLREMKRG